MQLSDIKIGVLYWVQIGSQAVRVKVLRESIGNAERWLCEDPDKEQVECALDQFLTRDTWRPFSGLGMVE